MKFKPVLYTVFGMTLLLLASSDRASRASAGAGLDASKAGPFVSSLVTPVVFEGDLRDLPRATRQAVPEQELPLRTLVPEAQFQTPADWVDPVAQTWQGPGQMPDPLASFAGLDRLDGGGYVPPDTNGDVGPNHYIQTVNVGIGIYDKLTGAELVNTTFNAFFNAGGAPWPCSTYNRGDVISLYDPLADRWLITDFAWVSGGGPYYQCIALSRTGDPVAGGWYFYSWLVDADSLHDYPKFGVWPDGYYMTANMFGPDGWEGARVWALDRDSMLNGGPLTTISFALGPAYGGLLPGNVRGAGPPADSPNYLASLGFLDGLYLWRFYADWSNPLDSELVGPLGLDTADFNFVFGVPQPAPGELLDTLSDRLMMQLQYRNMGSFESLWVNHTVSSGGVAGVRWYEIRDPGGSPMVHQQGTFQPDDQYRWMGSLAVDQDGNMAVGYSTGSGELMPSIRYAGRLAGEIPGVLTQREVSLIEGTGVQISGGGRWGDYSAMTVDPVDDCTFWYTQEYYANSGNSWQTRIGAFRFPSCGQPKGGIEGLVYDATMAAGITGVPVVAEGVSATKVVETDVFGRFSMKLPAGTFLLTAGPHPPGYPDPGLAAAVQVTAGMTTTRNIALNPQPYLVAGSLVIDDSGLGGNGNGYPEPGESGLLLWEHLSNVGAAPATGIMAELEALAPGLSISEAHVGYPDIAAGQSAASLVPFSFTIALTVPCGAQLDFQEVVSADQGVYTVTLAVAAKVPLPAVSILTDDVEAGVGGWTTGGTNNQWATSTESAHSPIHAWSDSPGGDYLNGTSAWLRSPTFDFTGKTGVSLSFWQRYDLETGWDLGYLEYSPDGGTSWENAAIYTGLQDGWVQATVDLAGLDDQLAGAFRFRLASDAAIQADGWTVDDIDLWYEPYVCLYPPYRMYFPVIMRPE